jgi:hypothetical protein
MCRTIRLVLVPEKNYPEAAIEPAARLRREQTKG